MRTTGERKARGIAIVAVALLLLLSAQIAISPDLRRLWINDLAQKRRFFVQPRAVLLGDSHVVLGGNWGWLLSGDPLSTISMATGGFTLAQVAGYGERATRYRPRFYIVQAGTNDVLLGATDPNVFATAYVRLVRQLRRTGARVIVVSIPPNAGSGTSRGAARFNAAARPAVERAGAEWLDLWPIAARGGVIRPELTMDGVHFVPAFYRQWGTVLEARMDRPMR